MTEPRKRLAFVAVMACLPFVVLAILEGSASLLTVVRLFRTREIAEESHARPDTLLGWANIANVSLADMYGPGVGMHINGQGFRHEGEVPPVPPPGKQRVICSGDSHTMGYGVDDAHPYCQRLAATVPSLETVNMGQGGYGLDQAYLWYLRDGLRLQPAVHLFAITQPDLPRLRERSFIGFPKPRLEISGDSVRVVGVPLPPPGSGRFFAKVVSSAKALRLFELSSALSGSSAKGADLQSDSATELLAEATLRQLARRDSAAKARLVVLFLPTDVDYTGHRSDRWRRWMAAATARDGIRFVDLVERLRRLPPDSVEPLFIQPGPLKYRALPGHYTDRGNDWVMRELLAFVPELSSPPGGPASRP